MHIYAAMGLYEEAVDLALKVSGLSDKKVLCGHGTCSGYVNVMFSTTSVPGLSACPHLSCRPLVNSALY